MTVCGQGTDLDVLGRRPAVEFGGDGGHALRAGPEADGADDGHVQHVRLARVQVFQRERRVVGAEPHAVLVHFLRQNRRQTDKNNSTAVPFCSSIFLRPTRRTCQRAHPRFGYVLFKTVGKPTGRVASILKGRSKDDSDERVGTLRLAP